MILDVRHKTSYRYASSASFSQHLLRLTPMDSATQKVQATRIDIDPKPEHVEPQEDMFGNLQHVATVSRPHGELEIVATCRIERRDTDGLIFEASAPWEETRNAALGINGASVVAELGPYAFPSQMTVADRAIEDYARQSFAPRRPILAAAAELSGRIYRDFTYQPGTTSADTLPTESFRLRKGVCQDFAHVMLAGLRALRVPSRYVSGYLRTVPPEGKERLQGADASHAWVAVWDPAFGWVEFDPTNDCVPGEDHVSLAHGRDYGDVSPVSGFVIGAGAQNLKVEVDVVPVVEKA